MFIPRLSSPHRLPHPKVFALCDRDGSGFIGLDELFRFVRGSLRAEMRTQRKMALIRTLTLQPKPGDGACAINTLDGQTIEYDDSHIWDKDCLRLELQTVLFANEIAAVRRLPSYYYHGIVLLYHLIISSSSA